MSRTFAVVWTDGPGRYVKTKRRGAEVMKVWKLWYIRHGWSVHSRGEAMIAHPPGWRENPSPSSRHAIVLREL